MELRGSYFQARLKVVPLGPHHASMIEGLAKILQLSKAPVEKHTAKQV